jgi:ABC-type multidrug transport system ATPase subunit
MSLTAKQNLIYASKLKNSFYDQYIDHEMNVSTIMSELMIEDTVNTKVRNCSGGEQKRLAIGIELTALNKPNLIMFDEPTTGLDSNVAEVVSHSML